MRIFLHELRAELRLYTRSKELAFFTFLLPIIFFVLLGSVYGGGDRIKGYRAPDYLLTGMLGYGVAATAFSGLAIVLVIRRETGVLKRLRATPLPAHVYITAVLLTSLIAFAIEAVFLIALGMLMFDAVFPKSVASVVVALLLGGATFAVLGIGVSGLVRRAEGASAVITALYLHLAEEDCGRAAADVLHRPHGGGHAPGRSALGPSRGRCRHRSLGTCRSGSCEAFLPLGSLRGLGSFKPGTQGAQWGLHSR